MSLAHLWYLCCKWNRLAQCLQVGWPVSTWIQAKWWQLSLESRGDEEKLCVFKYFVHTKKFRLPNYMHKRDGEKNTISDFILPNSYSNKVEFMSFTCSPHPGWHRRENRFYANLRKLYIYININKINFKSHMDGEGDAEESKKIIIF